MKPEKKEERLISMTATMDGLSSLSLMVYIHRCIKFSQPPYERTKDVKANTSQLTKHHAHTSPPLDRKQTGIFPAPLQSEGS